MSIARVSLVIPFAALLWAQAKTEACRPKLACAPSWADDSI
jgi:hypothetical protein